AFGELLVDGGSIVTVSSVSARSAASQEQSVYCASKAALSSITRSFAYAYAPRGIRVNAVLPGIVDTPMQDRFLEAAARARATTLDDLRAQVFGVGREVHRDFMGPQSELAGAWSALEAAGHELVPSLATWAGPSRPFAAGVVDELTRLLLEPADDSIAGAY